MPAAITATVLFNTVGRGYIHLGASHQWDPPWPAATSDEQRGLFHGGEVAASVELRLSHDVWEASVGQPPDRQEDVVWADRYPQWQRQRRQAPGWAGA